MCNTKLGIERNEGESISDYYSRWKNWKETETSRMMNVMFNFCFRGGQEKLKLVAGT